MSGRNKNNKSKEVELPKMDVVELKKRKDVDDADEILSPRRLQKLIDEEATVRLPQYVIITKQLLQIIIILFF